MVIKLPIADFELGIGVFRIGDQGFKSPIPNPKNPIPRFKITNWSFYHPLVIYTLSSRISCVKPLKHNNLHTSKQSLYFVCLLFLADLFWCK